MLHSGASGNTEHLYFMLFHCYFLCLSCRNCFYELLTVFSFFFFQTHLLFVRLLLMKVSAHKQTPSTCLHLCPALPPQTSPVQLKVMTTGEAAKTHSALKGQIGEPQTGSPVGRDSGQHCWRARQISLVSSVERFSAIEGIC